MTIVPSPLGDLMSPHVPFNSKEVNHDTDASEFVRLVLDSQALTETPAVGVPNPPTAEQSETVARFTYAPDAWEQPTIWSADPDRPALMLQRHQLPLDDAGDALWAIIVRAVGGAE